MTVSYQRTNGIAVIRIDDSKVNAMSSALIAQIHHALDQAESDKAITVISGNERLFSAGFDLKELRASKEAARKLKPGCGTVFAADGISLPGDCSLQRSRVSDGCVSIDEL